MSRRDGASEKRAANALRKAIDLFTEEFDGELSSEDMNALVAVRQLAVDMATPIGYVGPTGPR